MAVTDVASSAVRFRISYDAGTTYEKLVCKQVFNLDIEKPISEEDSDCQHHVSVGNSTKWKFDFEFLLNTTPASGETSAADVIAAVDAGTLLYLKVDNADSSATYYRAGTGYITNYKESAPLNGIIKGSGTFTGTGALDATA